MCDLRAACGRLMRDLQAAHAQLAGGLRVAGKWLAVGARQACRRCTTDLPPLRHIEIPKNTAFFLLQLFPAKNAVYFAHYG